MRKYLNKNAIRYYISKMIDGSNRLFKGKKLNTYLNELDTKINIHDSIYQDEYGDVNEYFLENTNNNFKIGTSDSLNKSNEVLDSYSDIIIYGNTYYNYNKYATYYTQDITDWYGRQITLCETSRLEINEKYTIIIDLRLEGSTKYNSFELGLSNILNEMSDLPASNIIKGTDVIVDRNGINVFVLEFKDFKDFKYLSARPIRRNTTPIKGESVKITLRNITILKGDHYNNPNIHQLLLNNNEIRSFGKYNDLKKNYNFSLISRNHNLLDFSIDNIYNENENFSPIIEDGGIKINSTYKKNDVYKFKKGFSLVKGKIYKVTINAKKLNNDYTACYLGGSDLTYGKKETYVAIVKNIPNNIISSIDDYSINSFTFTALQSRYVDNIFIHGADYSNKYYIKDFKIELEEATDEGYTNKIFNRYIEMNEPLRSLPSASDSIEKINGEYKIIRRVKEIEINGGSGLKLHTASINNNTLSWLISNDIGKDSFRGDNALICNEFSWFTYIIHHRNREGVGICNDLYNQDFRLLIKNDRLGDLPKTIENWNVYLNENPFTILYPLKNPIIEDINPISLEICKNGNISIDSNISTKSKHSISINKAQQIKNNLEELSIIKNRLYYLDNLYKEAILEISYNYNILRNSILRKNIKLENFSLFDKLDNFIDNNIYDNNTIEDLDVYLELDLLTNNEVLLLKNKLSLLNINSYNNKKLSYKKAIDILNTLNNDKNYLNSILIEFRINLLITSNDFKENYKN